MFLWVHFYDKNNLYQHKETLAGLPQIPQGGGSIYISELENKVSFLSPNLGDNDISAMGGEFFLMNRTLFMTCLFPSLPVIKQVNKCLLIRHSDIGNANFWEYNFVQIITVLCKKLWF